MTANAIVSTAETSQLRDDLVGIRRIPFMSGSEMTVDVQGRAVLKLAHGLKRPVRGVLGLEEPVGIVQGQYDKSTHVWVGSAAPWICIADITTTQDVTTVTIPDRDGDTEREYAFDILWATETGTTVALDLRPNGVTSNVQTAQLLIDDAVATAQENASFRISNVAGAAGNWSRIRGTFSAKTGTPRYIQWVHSHHDGTDTRHAAGTTRWSDTTTRVTSLAFTSSSASDIKDGSTFRVWRRGLGRKTLTLWVY